MAIPAYKDPSLQKKLTALPGAMEIYSKAFNGVKDAYSIGKFNGKKDHNNTWQANHRLIIEYIERTIDGIHRLPTVMEISKELKLSRVTVTNHLKNYKNNPAHELEKGMMNLMVERIFVEALRKGLEIGTSVRDLRDVLACYKLINPNSTPEIVINNMKIDINVFNNLPEKKKNQIIQILTKE